LAIIGEWYQLGEDVYVFVNKAGTVRKINKPKWYKVLLLNFYNFVGKKKHYQEVIQFLK
jgi:hypothetical protein